MDTEIIQILKNNIQQIENHPKGSASVHKWAQIYKGTNSPPLDIQEKKPFIKTTKGWQWFKNLVIPTIRVFPQSERKLQAFLNEQPTIVIPDDSKKEISEEKSNNNSSNSQYMGRLDCFKKQNNNTFELVELNGQQIKDLSEYHLSFKSLKFEETSFMTRSQYFLIVVTIYEQDSNGKNPQIKSIFISPQLSVDARKKYWSERQAQVSIFDPFLPSLVDKAYEKVSKKDGFRQMVGEDLSGVENYFTSYSIRHKIRNPFFLLFKFHKGVKLYYNTDYINQTDNMENLLKQLHKSIFKCFMSEQEEDYPRSSKPLILCLNAKDDDIQVKDSVSKINKFLGTLEGPALSYSPYILFQTPPNFTELVYSDKLKDSYKKVYNELLTLKFKIKDEEFQNSQQYQSMNTFTNIPNSYSQEDCGNNNNLFYQTVIQTNNKLGTVIDLCIRNPIHKEKCFKIKAQYNSENGEPPIKKQTKSNTNIEYMDQYTKPVWGVYDPSTKPTSCSQLNLSKLHIASLNDIPENSHMMMQNPYFNQAQYQNMHFEHPQEMYMRQLNQQYMMQQQQQMNFISPYSKQTNSNSCNAGSYKQLPSDQIIEQSSMPTLQYNQQNQNIIQYQQWPNFQSQQQAKSQNQIIQQGQQIRKDSEKAQITTDQSRIKSLGHIPSMTDITFN